MFVSKLSLHCQEYDLVPYFVGVLQDFAEVGYVSRLIKGWAMQSPLRFYHNGHMCIPKTQCRLQTGRWDAKNT